jgi:uncharacterized Zn-binding protein involved in type VI secretion
MPPAARMGDTVTGSDTHVIMVPSPGGPVPTPTPMPFQVPPTNQGTISKGSATVLINGKPAARTGDTVLTCNDPAPAPVGTIEATSTVMIGG